MSFQILITNPIPKIAHIFPNQLQAPPSKFIDLKMGTMAISMHDFMG